MSSAPGRPKLAARGARRAAAPEAAASADDALQARCGTVAPAAASGPEYASSPELALAALLYLLSRFPARRTPAIAHAIVEHLRIVGEDPRFADCIRDCAEGLVDDWRAYAMLSDDEGGERRVS